MTAAKELTHVKTNDDGPMFYDRQTRNADPQLLNERRAASKR